MTTATKVKVTRLPERFVADDSRVITRPFLPASDARIQAIIDRVMALSEPQATALLDRVMGDFKSRHRDLASALIRHFGEVARLVPEPDKISMERRLLIGAYFTMEYSIESAALFNPSMVPHPDQSGMAKGQVRFILSLRATGEGHVSSIVFRTGSIDAHEHLTFDPPSRYAARLKVSPDRKYEKKLFTLKLVEMGAFTAVCRLVMDELPEWFTVGQLNEAIERVRSRPDRPAPFTESADNMLWLANSNYRLELPSECEPSDIVIFPTSENESRGIEDLRLTRFVEDNGSVCYYGTYTAYNGFRILPQLLETTDFHHVEVHTLNGRYVQNKGMALFPRRIDGLYAMISRLDGENMFLMRSDNVHFWNECVKLRTPKHPWEFVQIGNCGPPLETDAGWILLTHGVGPMRQYCIGAMLLDRDDPAKVIGHLEDPLLMPEADERDGYVPNVVYSCGGMLQNGTLFLPYAMSDSATRFATVQVDELIAALLGN